MEYIQWEDFGFMNFAKKKIGIHTIPGNTIGIHQIPGIKLRICFVSNYNQKFS